MEKNLMEEVYKLGDRLRLYGTIINRMDWETDDGFECQKLYFYENNYYMIYMVNGNMMGIQKVQYTDYKVVGNVIEPSKICCLCGKPYTGYGNNPDPIKKSGRCCDNCNNNKVIPARIVGWSNEGQ